MVKHKSIFFDIVLILVTGGIWNIWMQYRQIRDYNKLSNTNNYSFFKWLILTLITFGLYHIYHEYKLTKDICLLTNKPDSETLGLLAALASISFLWVVVDIYQQEALNQRIALDLI